MAKKKKISTKTSKSTKDSGSTEKQVNKYLDKFINRLIEKGSTLLLVVVALVILFGFFNPFDFGLINKAKDLLGVNRTTTTELQEIVLGEVSGRGLFAEATREYSGTYILEKEGGILNCAGEKQTIENGVGTARVIVGTDGFVISKNGGQYIVVVPVASLDSVDLAEDLDVYYERNACVRLTQIFGGVSSESEVREKLRQELELSAQDDIELRIEAACKAEAQIQSLLASTDIDLAKVEYKHETPGVSCQV